MDPEAKLGAGLLTSMHSLLIEISEDLDQLWVVLDEPPVPLCWQLEHVRAAVTDHHRSASPQSPLRLRSMSELVSVNRRWI